MKNAIIVLTLVFAANIAFAQKPLESYVPVLKSTLKKSIRVDPQRLCNTENETGYLCTD